MVLDSCKKQNQTPNLDYWNSQGYSALLNRHELKKDIKQNPWSYELNPMLQGFLNNLKGLKQTLKFRVSGKILDSSMYVLKTKTNRIIDNSIETQEDIQEVQSEEKENDHLNELYDEQDSEIFIDNYEYDEEMELFEAFSELREDNFLSSEEIESIKREKVEYLLNLDAKDLNRRLEKKTKIIQAPPKILYKRIQLEDLGNALKEVIVSAKNKSRITEKKKKKVDKNRIPFLPEKLLENSEQKRAAFEERIKNFYLDLKTKFIEEPISFITLIKEATPERIVECVLIILHLINKKKIQLWTQFDSQDHQELKDNGKHIFLSPL